MTWLQTLGLTAGTGLIGTLLWIARLIVRGHLVPRATLLDERANRKEWQAIAKAYAENDRMRSRVVTRNNEMLARLLTMMEHAPWVVTGDQDGSGGWPYSGGNRPATGWSPPRQ